MTGTVTEQQRAVEAAVAVLRAGGLVAIPTETVYGLAADAANPEAVRGIFAAKGRPADHPLIVHVIGPEALDAVGREVSEAARTLAARFWPGPLTLVLRKSDAVPPEVTGGLETVAVRAPAHPLARALLKAFGGWLAAPSANRFKAVSPTTAEHVRRDLGDRVDLVLDGGPCEVGVESTIVDVSGAEPRILRPGGVSREELEAALGQPLAVVGTPDAVRAPGQLEAHYQPKARVEVVAPEVVAERARALREQGLEVVTLPVGEGEREFARALYARLRAADDEGADVIVVPRPGEAGLGAAILDRLTRAAHR